VLSPPTLEQFGRYGIAERALEHGRRVTIDGLEDAAPTFLELGHVEADALLAEVVAHGDAIVERGVRLVHVDDDEQSVKVELELADGTLEVARCGWLVRCDEAPPADAGVATFERGRVFMAGDAARARPAAVEWGVNAGIQDAGNLGWKLALAKSKRASPSLLSTYALEREPARADTLEAELAIDYKESPIVRDCGGDTALGAGARAPDAIITTDHTRTSVFDLFAIRPHTLLCDSRPETAELLVERLMPYSGLVHLVAVRTGDAAYERAYGSPNGDAIWIVRPDGYVGFRGHTKDVRALEAWLRSTFV
jgi:hypothetical protein